MKTHFIAGYLVSVLLASTAFAQSYQPPAVQPSTTNQPIKRANVGQQNTPQRMNGEEMRRFYSINGNSPQSGVTRTLGDGSENPYNYQPDMRTSRMRGNPPVGQSPRQVQRTAFVTQDETSVPAILAGKRNPTPNKQELVPPKSPVQLTTKQEEGFSTTPAFEPDQKPTTDQANMLTPTVMPGKSVSMPKQTAFEAEFRQEATDQPHLKQPSLDIGLGNQDRAVLNDNTRAENRPEAIPYEGDNASNPAMVDLGSIRQRESDGQPKPTITCIGPSINVETFGPKSISIGKPAQYQVRLENFGQTESGRILIGVEIPQWVDLSTIGMTNGTKEISDTDGNRRLLWTVDHVEPGQIQKLTLNVIPIRAQIFDMNVEWTLVPVSGAAQIEVTQPKLEMAISGPDAALYGETVLYNVTVRNPGTGVAENVSVMLSEALGGEREALGNINPGEEKNFQIELIARSAGKLELSATVTGDDNLQDTAVRNILVRRGILDVAMTGPRMKYSGSVATYNIVVANTGDAIAQDVYAAIGLPAGVQYISGLEGAEKIESGLRWQVGSLPPGEERAYKVSCQLDSAGDVDIETAARGAGDLADAASYSTNVETVADLVLSVADPKGPLPIGEDVTYTIKVKNRGSKVASSVDIVMHFAEGIEPVAASGQSHIAPGEIKFASIVRIEPGEEISYAVTARANVAGAHEFRAQLTCTESDSREVAGGTTKFFGEEVGEKGADFSTGELKNDFRNRK